MAIGRAVASGQWRLLPTQRLLLEADEPLVSVGTRPLDILIGMAERPGVLVGGNGMPESVVVSNPSRPRY